MRQLDLYVPVKNIISGSAIKLYNFVKYHSKLIVPVPDADGSIHPSMHKYSKENTFVVLAEG